MVTTPLRNFAALRFAQYSKTGRFAYGQRRVDFIRWCRTNACTTDQAYRYGFFCSRQTAQRKLNDWFKKNYIQMIGAVRDITCRPQPMYSTRRVNAIQHEYWLTEWVVQNNFSVVRGQHLEHHCDAVTHVTNDQGQSIKAYVELETGTSLDKFDRKFKRYQGCDGLVLIVTLTKEDQNSLMNMCEPIAAYCLFNVLGERQWHDIDGTVTPTLSQD